MQQADDDEEGTIDFGLFADDEATIAASRSWEPCTRCAPNGKCIELQPASAKVWPSALNTAIWLSQHAELRDPCPRR